MCVTYFTCTEGKRKRFSIPLANAQESLQKHEPNEISDLIKDYFNNFNIRVY